MTGRGGHITIGGKTVAVTGWSMTRTRPAPTDLDLLLAAVLAEPDEDTPRLAFADALDERGRPGDAERAATIRRMCQPDLRDHSFPGPAGTLRFDGPGEPFALTPPAAPGRCGQWEFCRGFVESVECTAADWIAHGDAILAAHPVTKVTLTTWPGEPGTSPDHWALGPQWLGSPRTDGFTRDDREFMVGLYLADRWPRIEFTLPAAGGVSLNGHAV